MALVDLLKAIELKGAEQVGALNAKTEQEARELAKTHRLSVKQLSRELELSLAVRQKQLKNQQNAQLNILKTSERLLFQRQLFDDFREQLIARCSEIETATWAKLLQKVVADTKERLVKHGFVLCCAKKLAPVLEQVLRKTDLKWTIKVEPAISSGFIVQSSELDVVVTPKTLAQELLLKRGASISKSLFSKT